jgi:hypothetical protein
MQCAMLLPTGIYALCLWYYGIPILALLTYLLIVTLVYPLIYIKLIQNIFNIYIYLAINIGLSQEKNLRLLVN